MARRADSARRYVDKKFPRAHALRAPKRRRSSPRLSRTAVARLDFRAKLVECEDPLHPRRRRERTRPHLHCETTSPTPCHCLPGGIPVGDIAPCNPILPRGEALHAGSAAGAGRRRRATSARKDRPPGLGLGTGRLPRRGGLHSAFRRLRPIGVLGLDRPAHPQRQAHRPHRGRVRLRRIVLSSVAMDCNHPLERNNRPQPTAVDMARLANCRACSRVRRRRLSRGHSRDPARRCRRRCDDAALVQ